MYDWENKLNKSATGGAAVHVKFYKGGVDSILFIYIKSKIIEKGFAANFIA